MQFSSVPIVDNETISRRGEWPLGADEGQLPLDVIDTDKGILIVAPIAGADAETLQVYIHNDLVTIRGVRETPKKPEDHYLYEECFWGKFSRTIVLPVDVKGELSRAEYRTGLLTIYIPKRTRHTTIPITIVDE